MIYFPSILVEWVIITNKTYGEIYSLHNTIFWVLNLDLAFVYNYAHYTV